MADQYKIPQNIDVEDKILGPFTLKQFIYLIAGGTAIYILFNVFGQTNFNLFLIISVPIAILTLALVFIKVNERPFISFIAYFSEYVREGKQKKWEKSTRIRATDTVIQMSSEEKDTQKEFEKKSKQGIVKSRLNELSIILDTSGWSGEMIDENLKGRISSSSDSASDIQKTLGQEEKIEDVFADLEEAFDKLAQNK